MSLGESEKGVSGTNDVVEDADLWSLEGGVGSRLMNSWELKWWEVDLFLLRWLESGVVKSLLMKLSSSSSSESESSTIASGCDIFVERETV